jgi:hypothetical protein
MKNLRLTLLCQPKSGVIPGLAQVWPQTPCLPEFSYSTCPSSEQHRPSLSAAQLQALSATARLHVRADGDSVGWSIVNLLLAELPNASLWRMPQGLAAYEEELLEDLIQGVRLDP